MKMEEHKEGKRRKRRLSSEDCSTFLFLFFFFTISFLRDGSVECCAVKKMNDCNYFSRERSKKKLEKLLKVFESLLWDRDLALTS